MRFSLLLVFLAHAFPLPSHAGQELAQGGTIASIGLLHLDPYVAPEAYPAPLTLQGEFTFPIGTRFRIKKVEENALILEHEGKLFRVTNDLASYYFEGEGLRGKYLLGEALAAMTNPGLLEQAPQCVDLPEKEVKNPCDWSKDRVERGEWDANAMRNMAWRCPVKPVEIIRRVSPGLYSKECRNGPGPTPVEEKSKTWKGCGVPPACSREVTRDCLRTFEKPVKRLVVHYSNLPSDTGPGGIYDFHRDHQQFTDMGYHFVIAKDSNGKWRAYEGRPRGFVGAHGGPGANEESLGVLIAGCYQVQPNGPTNPCREGERPPPEATKLLMDLIAKLKQEVKGPDGKPSIHEIAGHGEHRAQYATDGKHTDCPSPSCQFFVHRLRERFFEEKK